ncbi:hypothetical protein JTB14_035225 [Gonioctena quinquepunctata]|nr:hypothetical protein JTB14_035225 [Gonioctena quinquepunctata]
MHMLDITPIVLVILCTSHEAWEYFESGGLGLEKARNNVSSYTHHCAFSTTRASYEDLLHLYHHKLRQKCGCKKAGLRYSRSCKNCVGDTCFNAADIVEKNNEEDDDNLEDLEHADEETVESEYIVKPGYLQVIRGIFGDGSDNDVGDHDAETVRDADEQSEEILTDQQPSTSDCQLSRKRRKRE